LAIELFLNFYIIDKLFVFKLFQSIHFLYFYSVIQNNNNCNNGNNNNNNNNNKNNSNNNNNNKTIYSKLLKQTITFEEAKKNFNEIKTDPSIFIFNKNIQNYEELFIKKNNIMRVLKTKYVFIKNENITKNNIEDIEIENKASLKSNEILKILFYDKIFIENIYKILLKIDEMFLV
jgi:hypothetical protein